MNPTLYTQLAPLGFAEWLNKKLNAKINFNEWMTEKDKLPLDSIGRTELNALAFRWMREEKDIFFEPIQHPQNKFRYGFEYEIGSEIETIEYGGCNEMYETYELSEHEALCKALEILSKGGENG